MSISITCPACQHKFSMTEQSAFPLLTASNLQYAMRVTQVKVKNASTSDLIFKVLNITPFATVNTAIQFLKRVQYSTEEQIVFGIEKFFREEYHLKGYEWQWCAGMIKREAYYKEHQEKANTLPLPKEFKNESTETN